jgi:hypothetical protein
MKFESAVWRGGDGGEVEGRRGVDGRAGVVREWDVRVHLKGVKCDLLLVMRSSHIQNRELDLYEHGDDSRVPRSLKLDMSREPLGSKVTPQWVGSRHGRFSTQKTDDVRALNE